MGHPVYNIYNIMSVVCIWCLFTDTQIRHTFLPHGLYCRNGKPNISFDCESFEGSTNRALVSEQTLLELNLFLCVRNDCHFFNPLTKSRHCRLFIYSLCLLLWTSQLCCCWIDKWFCRSFVFRPPMAPMLSLAHRSG